MASISVQNLTFGYDGASRNVFENVSFRIDTDWKLGFVGRNGRGKTTFLKLLSGAYEHDGTIAAPVDFLYFPFPVRDPKRMTLDVLRDANPTAEDWEFMRKLGLMDVSADVLYRPFDTLSDGEQTKAQLSALFATDGGFLLIDEPTNHLDTRGRQTVSAYLNRKKGFIVVSHDRAFLDGCVDHILSINKTDVEIESGNFSSYLTNFERRQAFEAAKSEQLKKDIARLQTAAARTADWSAKVEATKYGKTSAGLKPDRGHVGRQAAKLMQQALNVEARQQKAIAEKSALLKNAESIDRIKLYPLWLSTDELLSLTDVAIEYDGRKVCKPVRFTLHRGERIVLDGGNGAGKSSLLKLILGQPIRHTGSVHLQSGLKFSYVPQSTAHLAGNLKVFIEERALDESLFRAMLNKLDFPRDDFSREIAAYSEGQKKKIILAASLCERAHVYIWDEPLNFVDIYARLQIENLIKDFHPTMLMVEHDVSFQNAVATNFVPVLPATD